MYDNKITLTQPVFMWWKIYCANRQATLNYECTKEEYRKIKQKIIYKTQETFYKYALAKQMVLISKEAFDVTESHLKVIEKFYDEGKSSSYDVSLSRVSLANIKTALIRSENGFDLAKHSLINILNVSETNIELVGELQYHPKEFDIDNLINDALINRPEIKQTSLQEDISKLLVKLASTGNKPNIVVSGYTEWQNTKLESKNWYNSWTAMALLTMPIFDGFSTYQKTQQAKANVEQVKLFIDSLKEDIKFEVRTAYLNYKQANDSIEANKENVDAAKGNLTTAQERFQLGLMTNIEVKDAQLSLTQAETNYIQALYDYNVAIASLEYAIGK